MKVIQPSPKLRFKKENGEKFPEWVKYKLGEISLITKGRPIDLENKTKQGYPVIAGGKTSPYSYKFFTHENCITVSGSGAHAGHIAYHPYKFWGSDCSIVSGTNSNSVTLFVYYLMFFHQRKIYSLQIGGAQPHVYPKTLKSLTVSVPPNVNEQQKIAGFLAAIDDRIESLEQKNKLLEQYKYGLMQKLFNRELRFKDKGGEEFAEWKTKRLEDLFQIKAGGDIDKEHFQRRRDEIYGNYRFN